MICFQRNKIKTLYGNVKPAPKLSCPACLYFHLKNEVISQTCRPQMFVGLFWK